MELASFIVNIVLAVVAISGVIIAGLGLKTWRKQLKGTTEYELAKRLLLEVYRIRNAIGYVRNPFLRVTEADSKNKDVPWEVSAYEKRWKELRKAIAKFDTASLEGEVIWGTEVLNLKKDLHKIINELYIVVESFIRSKQNPASRRELTEKEERILYDVEDDDPYNKGLDAIIKKFEDYVKPHLKR